MKLLERSLKTVKIIGGLAISIGVGAVATNLVKATTPEDIKKFTKICIGIGSFAVSGMAAAAASNRFEETIDGIIETAQGILGSEDENQENEEQAEA